MSIKPNVCRVEVSVIKGMFLVEIHRVKNWAILAKFQLPVGFSSVWMREVSQHKLGGILLYFGRELVPASFLMSSMQVTSET